LIHTIRLIVDVDRPKESEENGKKDKQKRFELVL